MKQLQLRQIDLNSVPVIFAQTKPNDEYNACKLSQLNHIEIKVEAVEAMPTHLQISLSSKSGIATAELPLCLKL